MRSLVLDTGSGSVGQPLLGGFDQDEGAGQTPPVGGMDGFWMLVLVGVVTGIILIITTATGRRVRNWLSTLPGELKDRRRKARRAKDEKALIAARQDVRHRSETLDIDLPWSRDTEWLGPGVRVIRRSGIDWFYINAWEHGIGQYEAAVISGTVPPGRTTTTAASRVVEHWRLVELEEWLQEHPSES